jgi:hypothetical protein
MPYCPLWERQATLVFDIEIAGSINATKTNNVSELKKLTTVQRKETQR